MKYRINRGQIKYISVFLFSCVKKQTNKNHNTGSIYKKPKRKKKKGGLIIRVVDKDRNGIEKYKWNTFDSYDF